MPVRTVKTMVMRIAGFSSWNIQSLLCKVQQAENPVDDPDPGERRDDPAEAVDQKVAAQQGSGGERPVFHAAKGQRHERDDDERIEYDRGENGALWRMQPHDVE